MSLPLEYIFQITKQKGNIYKTIFFKEDFLNTRAQLYILSASFLILPLFIGPWFSNYFRTPKWVFLYAVSLILLATSNIILIPEFKVKKIMGVVFAAVVSVIIFHFHAPWSPLIFDILCFLVLTLATYSVA